ncbi:ATP-dependent DNA ligase [Caldisphaera lagunensis DSM 15908]|uniref:DNA ligase n=1 Tax=Caldisphaera lagunensis (strain DSM 15908 / JCM 11604 / ANMR 0165 / IC-154) TaxID=1056495 RepID=L0ADP1_CALLD|nr:ATP-dependent DNA ligase [Caldisphaera lagunensis]AFZ71155.1 ATP-dependent DNA ligase [Caldisphaera lagunensis DSM 15908]
MSKNQNDLPFREVAETFDSMEKITSRISLTQLLVKLIKDTPPEVIGKVVYLIQGRLGPDWKDIPELGVGEKLIIQALSIAFGKTEQEVNKIYNSVGDLGKVAESFSQSKQKKSSLMAFIGSESSYLTVGRVFDSFLKIAYSQGEGSRDLKLRLIAGLLKDAQPIEARYIVRFLEGRLRLGIGDATILDALSISYGGSTSYREIVERAYNLRADLGEIAYIIATQGIESIKELKPEIGTPIRPMLAERLSDPEEILQKVQGKGFVEYKYDGERGQFHKDGDNVRIFSRRLEDITDMYPDVVEAIKNSVKSNKVIFEGEIVAYDTDTGELRPFQELMHRRRKYDIQKMVEEIPVKAFLFDVLLNEDEDLTRKTLPYRRKILENIVNETDKINIAKYIETDDPKTLWNFFLTAISEGAEGVMVKAIHDESIYRAGVRGWLWIKLKRDYKSEMTDTVDLVAVGGFYGRGRRGGKIGTLLFAAYDPENDVFRTVCKVGSGYTDDDLNKMYDLFKPYIIDHKHPRVESSIEPDLWFEPVRVAEIIGAELTLSPLHTCCYNKLKEGAGLSIRFPRFIRWREDKGPEDATTEEELIEMYNGQLKKIEEKQTKEEVQGS